MRKGLFVLNTDLSGINAWMFAALRSCGWDVRVWDAPIPTRLKYAAAAKSFHWHRARWQQRFHQSLARSVRTDRGLIRRSELCSNALRRLARPDDLVLSFGTLFNPSHLAWKGQYVLFKDYTTALASRSLSPSLPVRGSDLQRWIIQEGDACRRASCVFTASDNTRNSIVRDYGVAAENVVTVGEGLCFDEVPPPRTPSRQLARNNILFVGKDFYRKGGDTVLAAFCLLLKHIPTAHLTIVGPPNPPPPPLPPNVFWRGLVKDRNTVREHYANADVFVMPSRTEPFGLVFLEAMAHGLPCVGSARDAMPEIIQDGHTGFLVEPGDESTLCERLAFLLEHPMLAHNMGRLGYERVTSRFLWTHVAQRMDEKLLQVSSASCG